MLSCDLHALIIGVDCTKDRSEEYDYTLRGQLYAKFLIETLKPWVDRNFRTLSDRENTFAMGSSMGGLISMALVWHHSDGRPRSLSDIFASLGTPPQYPFDRAVAPGF